MKRNKIKKNVICALMCVAIGTSLTIMLYASETEQTNISANKINDYYIESELDSSLSPGIRVIAYDSPMIVSGTAGETIQFSAEIFNDYNGYVPSSVKIVSVPDSDSGTLLYNNEPVSVGQSISVLSLSSMSYKPYSNNETEFTFSSDNANITRCILRQQHSKNTPPKSTENSSVTTYTRTDTEVGGFMGGVDLDGDSVTYEIVSAPKKGIISVTDKSTGQFVYHPYEKMYGTDSFTYRICDHYGAYSEIGEIKIDIGRQKSIVYDDMVDSNYKSAVNDIVEANIMQTANEEEKVLFYPDEPVSKIDFLIMAMKTMGASEVKPTGNTIFSDDDTLSDIEKGYLQTAYNLGIIKGDDSGNKLVFKPDEAITGASAAVILNGILGIPDTSNVTAASLGYDIPVWAKSAFTALQDNGIIDHKTAPCYSELTREKTAAILSGLLHKIEK